MDAFGEARRNQSLNARFALSLHSTTISPPSLPSSPADTLGRHSQPLAPLSWITHDPHHRMRRPKIYGHPS